MENLAKVLQDGLAVGSSENGNVDKQAGTLGCLGMFQQGKIERVAHELSGIVAEVGVRQVGGEAGQVERRFEDAIALYCLYFQIQAIARFCHATAHDEIGLKLMNMGDRQFGRLLKIDRQPPQQMERIQKR